MVVILGMVLSGTSILLDMVVDAYLTTRYALKVTLVFCLTILICIVLELGWL